MPGTRRSPFKTGGTKSLPGGTRTTRGGQGGCKNKQGGTKGRVTPGCKVHDSLPSGVQPTGESKVYPGTQSAKQTYEFIPAHGEVLVIMRYKAEMDRRMRNCLIRMKSRTGQFGTEGRCLGITANIRKLEDSHCSDWCMRDDWCLAMFIFPSLEKARLWYISEPELRQHDFLPPSDGVQLFAMNLRYVLQPGRKMTFNWFEMHNVRPGCTGVLQQDFVNKTAEMLDDQNVNHGVVFLQDPTSPFQLFRLKEAWLPHNQQAYCVLNVYDDPEQFWGIHGTDRYSSLRNKRGEVCDTVSLLFTIDPNVTGAPEHGSN